MRMELAVGEYYHVFNRGVEKRDIFMDEYDIQRFLLSIGLFNTLESIGSIFENKFAPTRESEPLIGIIAYCLNPNHYHLLLHQKIENGIQKFMQRLGTGYTNYFNEKYERTGVLFQGKYKAVHVSSNEQLLHTSVYVNLNNQLGSRTPKLSASSWNEYLGKGGDLCSKDIILGQFRDIHQYELYAKASAEDIAERKRAEKEMAWLGSPTPK